MIPVVLIHWGRSARYPIETVIGQAIKYGNAVTLIEDHHDAEVNLEDYSERADEFVQYYVHLSGNHAEFELRCLQRWYILHSWMTRNHFDVVLYTDSDVLLYCNAETEWRNFQDYAFTLALGTSPATSYFTLAGLEAFLSFVDSVYIRQNEFFQEFKRIYAEMQAQGLPGGISDMTCFKFFREQVHHVKVGEMTGVINGSTWDHNINSSDGYVMENGIKKFRWINEIPYGSNANGGMIRFNAIHFQGQAKPLINRFIALAES